VPHLDRGGCSSALPAGDPATDLRHNTTQYLIADMDRLLEHLGRNLR
jgi:proline iminopeptidase